MSKMAQPTEEKVCKASEKSTSANLLSESSDIASYTQTVLKSVLGAVKSSNELPTSGDDFDYYSSFPAFTEVMKVEGQRILNNITELLRHSGIKVKLDGNDSTLHGDEFDTVIDANDGLMERVGASLDEATGDKKKDQSLLVSSLVPKDAITTSWNRDRCVSPKSSGYKLLAAKNILRPQIKFKDKVDNSNALFEPNLQKKHNALKPCNPHLSTDEDEKHSSHPYQYELDHFQPLDDQLEQVTPAPPAKLDNTPLSFIRTVEKLEKLTDILKGQREFAVDLEAHSYRTFQGFTCLMQLSTESHDYIIDTLELRSEMHMLNEVFTDPKIVKVFHGADLDIVWLQRDFSIYVVNMFDTGQASRVLGRPRHGLSHLLRDYCKVEADKQYQLADWRIRPLPDELVRYARSDTHYLLYIYAVMKNELLAKGNKQKNLLLSVLERSRQLCETVYVKPVFNEELYREVYARSKKVFNNRQLAALKNLYAWRDGTARKEDESTGYVLPNHMLLQICEALPREMQGILACCNPIPTPVRQQLNDIHQIILKARDVPLSEATTISAPVKLQSEDPKLRPDSLLNCPHDFSHLDDPGEESHYTDTGLVSVKMSSLFGPSSDKLIPASVVSNLKRRKKPIVNIFADSPDSDNSESKEPSVAFASPFQRFLATKPLPPEEPEADEDASEKSSDEKYAMIQKLNQQFISPGSSIVNVSQEMEKKEEKERAELEKKKQEEEQRRKAEETVANHIKTLREQMEKKKKKKRTVPDIAVQSSNSNLQPVNKKSRIIDKKQVEPEQKKTFTPFDYSKSDTSVFASGSSNKDEPYDPNKKGKKLKSKGSSKHSGSRSSGKKSTTYSRGVYHRGRGRGYSRGRGTHYF